MAEHRTDVSLRASQRVECPCCARGLIVRVDQVWKHRIHDAAVRIIEPDKDGAIVEQTDREGDRWGMSYFDLVRGYKRV